MLCMRSRCPLLALLAVLGCDHPSASLDGAPAAVDATVAAADAAASADQVGPDAAAIPDASLADVPAIDGPVVVDAAFADDAAGADAGPLLSHVDIYISNTCATSVVPGSITVPSGTDLYVTFHNNSVDYNADAWCSWGGGYLDLATGGLWDDPIPFCSAGPGPYDAGAEISIAGGGGSACPSAYLTVHCL